MNEFVIIGVSSVIAAALTMMICKLIDYIVAKRCKEVQNVYKSRKLNKIINVDKIGE